MKKSIIAAALAASVSVPALAQWTESAEAGATFHSSTPALNAPNTETLTLYSVATSACEISPMLIIVSGETGLPSSGEFPLRYRFDRKAVQYHPSSFNTKLSDDGNNTYIYLTLPTSDRFIDNIMTGNSVLIGIDQPGSDATSKFSLKGSTNAIGSILSDCANAVAVDNDPWGETETNDWSENQSEVEWGI